MRTCLLLAVLLPTPTAAELNVTARLEDLRVSDRKVYLSREFDGDPKTGKPVSIGAYLPAADAGQLIEWELVFESAEILRQAVDICRYKPSGTKILVRAREVQTLRGRALLVESIRSNW